MIFIHVVVVTTLVNMAGKCALGRKVVTTRTRCIVDMDESDVYEVERLGVKRVRNVCKS